MNGMAEDTGKSTAKTPAELQGELDAALAEVARLKSVVGSHHVAPGTPANYEYHPFPKYVYHKKSPLKGRLVEDQAELDALGKDWADSPATWGVETHPSKPVA